MLCSGREYDRSSAILCASVSGSKDKADVENLVSKFGPDGEERRLLNLGRIRAPMVGGRKPADPSISAAFDERYESSDYLRRAEKAILKAQQKFLAEPNPNQTRT